MKPNDMPPAAQLMRFIVGKWLSKPIHLAAELGIADLLGEGPKTAEELAGATQTHAPSLYRIMRALASVGVFSETEERRFELTPMAEYLKDGAMRSIALMFNAEWNEKAWGHLLDCVKTGTTAFEKAHGMPIFRWLEGHPEAAAVLNEANAVKAATSHRAIVEAYDFSEINTLTDVGGGYGTLMMEILAENPRIKGTVADIPAVVRVAKKGIRSRGFDNRCEVVACDFFKTIPPGRDGYILSHVLHDWPDEACITILNNCREAMTPESRLLVVEMIVPPGNEPSVAKLLDLEMLVITGGRERTEKEFKSLLESAGLVLSRVIPTRESICVIEGIKK